jgi:hypothetical protein
MPTGTRPPLPKLVQCTTTLEEFASAGQLIASARTAFVSRDEPYERRLDDRMLKLGLDLAASAARACANLAVSDPFWCCVCARPYLEFALRLLWASRRPDGFERFYSYYAHKHREWLRKLAQRDAEHKLSLDEMDRLAPVTGLGAQMPPDMRVIVNDIGAEDRREQVHSLYVDPIQYDESIAFLHMFSHANPLFLEGNSDDYLPHAGYAVIEATAALLRAVGYRMGWDQNAVNVAVLRAGSFDSLSPEDQAKGREAFEEYDRRTGQAP